MYSGIHASSPSTRACLPPLSSNWSSAHPRTYPCSNFASLKRIIRSHWSVKTIVKRSTQLTSRLTNKVKDIIHNASDINVLHDRLGRLPAGCEYKQLPPHPSYSLWDIDALLAIPSASHIKYQGDDHIDILHHHRRSPPARPAPTVGNHWGRVWPKDFHTVNKFSAEDVSNVSF